jgi:hypothetical protein
MSTGLRRPQRLRVMSMKDGSRPAPHEELLLAIDQLRLRRPDDPWLIPVRFDNCNVPELELGAGPECSRRSTGPTSSARVVTGQPADWSKQSCGSSAVPPNLSTNASVLPHQRWNAYAETTP